MRAPRAKSAVDAAKARFSGIFADRGGPPIKAAAPIRDICEQTCRSSATFAPAQALVICSMPHRKQNQRRLENMHCVTFIEQLASARKRTISQISNHRRTSRAHRDGSRFGERRKRKTMNTGLSEGSAKIYQFPVGGRAALAGRRYCETKTTDMASPPSGDSACSGSWYHQAAIDESNLVRDH